jgi:ribosomal protein S18 acetylase RimI-like enzyme
MEIAEVDLSKPDNVEKLVQLLDAYQRTPSGGGMALSAEARIKLANEIPRYSNTIAFYCEQHTTLAGVVLGFYNLYLFAAQPYANIQFIFVRPEFQHCGIARRLMLAFETKARALGCCKVTLEVRASNAAAKALYQGLEYRPGIFGPQSDVLEFWERRLV